MGARSLFKSKFKKWFGVAPAKQPRRWWYLEKCVRNNDLNLKFKYTKLDEMLEIGLSVFAVTTFGVLLQQAILLPVHRQSTMMRIIFQQLTLSHKHSKNIICITSIPFDHVSCSFHLKFFFCFFSLTLKNPPRIVYIPIALRWARCSCTNYAKYS